MLNAKRFAVAALLALGITAIPNAAHAFVDDIFGDAEVCVDIMLLEALFEGDGPCVPLVPLDLPF